MQDTPVNDAAEGNVDTIVEHTGPITEEAVSQDVQTETTTQETVTEETATEESVYTETAATDDGTQSEQTEEIPTEDHTETETEETPGDEETKETTEETTTESEEETTETEQEGVVNFDSELSSVSGGEVTNTEDLKTLLQDYKVLKEGPRFESDAAKALYEYANKFPGGEIEAARKVHHVMSLEVDKLEAKELLFEDFRLKEENGNLSPGKAAEIFNEIYERKYGEAKDDNVVDYELGIAVDKAKKSLTEMQTNFSDSKSKESSQDNEQQKQLQEGINSNVEKTMGNFKGIAIPISQESDRDFNYQVDKAEDRQSIQDGMAKPFEWLQNQINAFEKDGQFDYNQYSVWWTELTHMGNIREAMYRQGFNDGQTKKVETLTNPPKEKEGVPIQKEGKKTNEDMAWDHLAEKGIIAGPYGSQ